MFCRARRAGARLGLILTCSVARHDYGIQDPGAIARAPSSRHIHVMRPYDAPRICIWRALHCKTPGEAKRRRQGAGQKGGVSQRGLPGRSAAKRRRRTGAAAASAVRRGELRGSRVPINRARARARAKQPRDVRLIFACCLHSATASCLASASSSTQWWARAAAMLRRCVAARQRRTDEVGPSSKRPRLNLTSPSQRRAAHPATL